VDAQNSAYASVEGVLFNKAQTALIQYPGGKLAASYSIPNGVTNIGSGAFGGCTRLASIAIPNSVTSIEDGAFGGCTSLTDLTMPTNLTSIANSTFSTCSSLASITIPDRVTTIGLYAFDYCGALTKVTFGNGVTNIGDLAFAACTSLASITFPASVTRVGNSTFSMCFSLKSVFFEGNAPRVGFSPFTTSSTIYYLPGTTGWGSTFAGCPALLWNPLIKTGDGAFGVRTNRFGFNITGTSKIPVVVEASSNLASKSWTSLQTCTLTNGSVYFSDAAWTNYPARFYRIRSP